MKAPPSLTRRLIVSFLLIQLLGSLLAWSASCLLEIAGVVGNFDVELPDYAYDHLRRLIIDSLVEDASGALRVVPTPALRARAEQMPDFRFAVLETIEKPPLPGSSEELASVLSGNGRLRSRGQRFAIPKGDGTELRGYVGGAPTRFGPLYVAEVGHSFVWTDWFYALNDDIGFIAVFFLVVSSASAAVTWLAVRDALSPLRRVAAQAQRIDMDSLGQGVDPRGLPSEVRPVIDAMNAALTRLDGSVMRMRRYTANAAHELRTPLAVLRARLQNEEERSFKADLEQDARQLQAIVEQMLIAARLGEGQVSLEEEVDLAETVWSVVAGRAPLAIKCRRQIEFETVGTAPVVRGNARAIASVVGNLVDNALRAEPEGGAIVARVAGATIEIVDHGEGVAPIDREMIFEPFWRKSEATPGTGLGLAVAKELMDKMRGRIFVEETPGGGATFKLSLPEAPAQAARAP